MPELYLIRIPGKRLVTFTPGDLFVGVYWKYWHSAFMEYWYIDFYILLVPMFPICFRLERPSPFQERVEA